MTVFEDIRLRARHIWLSVFGALVLAYFSYHMIQGNHGVIALLELRSNIAAAEIIQAETSAEHQRLVQQVTLLRPDNLDPDMLEERTRVMLNYVHPDEMVIIAPQQQKY
ncbi:MAG: septum formation initiator family protein [Alphaproteobacteria bacterium]|nr:septum formation initiator family protein [Alphaproteobacteria bacterium]